MHYLWVDHNGKAWGYLNIGNGTNQWHNLSALSITGNYERRKIRMAVLTNSSRADHITIDDETGAAEWWQNVGLSYNYDWAYRGLAANGPKKTLQKVYGWNLRGEKVRFVEYVIPN